MRDASRAPRRPVQLALLAAALSVVGIVGWAQAQTGESGGDAGARQVGAAWTPVLPAAWRALPAIASQATDEALRAAAAAGVSGLDFRARVWGDPGSGVFLLVADASVASRALDARHASESLERDIRTALASVGFAPVTVDVAAPGDDETTPAAGSELAGEQSAPVTTGFALHVADERVQCRLRTRVEHTEGRIDVAAAACFHSPREPEHAAQVCRDLLYHFERAAPDRREEAE